MNTYQYEEVMDKINNARRFGKQPGVIVMQSVLEQLNMKQHGIPYIHVAGTNGKGSVCAFLSSIFKEAGYKVGTFISPHLMDFEERIMVNGQMISKEEVTRIGNFLLQESFDVELTMFDYCLAMALIYFQKQKVDLMVIETGLGGRLDSTNALGTPQIGVITKIGFDHTAILGDTLTSIAREKAGIIKMGCPMVFEQQEKEVMEVLCSTFYAKNATKADKEKDLYMVSEQEISYTKELQLKLPGVHQWENAAAAMLAAKAYLKAQGSNRDSEIDAIVQRGLERASWPGRMEVLSDNPFFMADGAHNGHGVHALVESLTYMYPGEKFCFFMGVMADKDYEQMVQEMLPLAKCFYTYTPESTRALQSSKLAAFINDKGIPAKACDTFEELLDHLSKSDKNIAFGSLYFIGDLKQYWGNYLKN